MTEQANMVKDRRAQVIGMVTEARNRLDKHAVRAQEIRARGDLSAERRRLALDEVLVEARTRIRALIRDARHGASGGFSVGNTEAAPYSPRSWRTGLTAAQETIRSGMLSYIDSAERVFEARLEEMSTGAPPTATAATARDAATAEVASYEAANPAPPGITPSRARWKTIG